MAKCHRALSDKPDFAAATQATAFLLQLDCTLRGPLARETDCDSAGKLVHHPIAAVVFIEPPLVSQFGSERHVSKAEREFQCRGCSRDRLAGDGKGVAVHVCRSPEERIYTLGHAFRAREERDRGSYPEPENAVAVLPLPGREIATGLRCSTFRLLPRRA